MPPPLHVRLGTVIRRLRTDRKLTQERLAILAHVHPTYLRKIELGRLNPTIDAAERIALALDLSLDQVILRAEELS